MTAPDHRALRSETTPAAAGSPETGAEARPGGVAAAGGRATQAPTLATDRLSVSYHTEEGAMPAVRDVSLIVRAGQAVGLVGESGSGKTTLALAAIGYLPENGRVESGASRLHGVDVVSLSKKELRDLWGSKIGLVSQDPQGALNPTLTVGRQLDEMGIQHLGLSRAGARQASLAMLERVHMPDPPVVIERYPHQLSGGMLQRCAIAMALLTHPDLLILDEPTTALDVTTQALILDLLEDLSDEFHLAVLYITHNLGVVARFCDRVMVMYAGEVFEEGPVLDLFSRPLHPYTANLLHCVPRLARPPAAGGATALPPGAAAVPAVGPNTHAGNLTPSFAGGRLATLPGNLPPLNDLPGGCIFAPRCPLALEICTVARPPLVEAAPGRQTACLRWQVMLSDQGQRDAIATEDLEAAAPGPRTFARPAATPVGAPDAHARGAARATPGTAPGAPLLTVTDLVKDFAGPRRHTSIRAVDGVTLELDRRRTFGLVGESGSGKTTLARMVAGLTPPTAGSASLDGKILRPTVDKRSTDILRRLQMVFQSPESSLNPRHTVRQELVRPLMRLTGLDRHEAEQRARELLHAVRLPPAYLDRYPGELSGGEKQRVAIARAFVAGPDLVICDEPVSSLDVSVQGALMNLLLDLQSEEGASYLFISHDLAAVQHLSHFIGVMYLGKLVEQGEAARVLSPPYHPYTEALLSAVPDPDPRTYDRGARFRARPTLGDTDVAGCPFHVRCPRYLGDVCRAEEPPWRGAGAEAEPAPPGGGDAEHAIRCHIPYEELRVMQAPGGPPEGGPAPGGLPPQAAAPLGGGPAPGAAPEATP